jgi:hypothetical protein
VALWGLLPGLVHRAVVSGATAPKEAPDREP